MKLRRGGGVEKLVVANQAAAAACLARHTVGRLRHTVGRPKPYRRQTVVRPLLRPAIPRPANAYSALADSLDALIGLAYTRSTPNHKIEDLTFKEDHIWQPLLLCIHFTLDSGHSINVGISQNELRWRLS